MAVVAAEVEHRRGRAARDDVGRRRRAEAHVVVHSRTPRFSRRWARALGVRVAERAQVAARSARRRTASKSLPKRRRSALYSARSTTGSRRSTAALARERQLGEAHPQRGLLVVADAGRRRRARAGPRPGPGVARRPARASRTKSLLGSKTTMGSRVVRRMRSSSTPRAYVLPEPLWPHQKVCRLRRLGMSATPTAVLAGEVAEVQLRVGPRQQVLHGVGPRRADGDVVPRRAAPVRRRAGPATELHEDPVAEKPAPAGSVRRRPRRRRARRPRPRARGSPRRAGVRSPGPAPRRTSRPATPDEWAGGQRRRSTSTFAAMRP